MRDYQKQRVYDWENKVIAPRCKRQLSFEQAQSYVNGIWLAQGWLFPPLIGLMAKQSTRIFANGCRLQINIREDTPAWVILHELAHTLTCDIDGRSDGHGPDFVGMYIKLLEDVENIPRLLTMYSLKQDGIDFNLTAKPWMNQK